MSKLIEMPAIIVGDVYAYGLVAPVPYNGQLIQRTGECRSYRTEHRGLTAVFMSAAKSPRGPGNMVSNLGFDKGAVAQFRDAIHAKWRKRLVGFVDLFAIEQANRNNCKLAWLDNQGPDYNIWRTRQLGPPHGGLVLPKESPIFDDVCAGCADNSRDAAALRNHRISSHTRVQRVRLPAALVARYQACLDTSGSRASA